MKYLIVLIALVFAGMSSCSQPLLESPEVEDQNIEEVLDFNNDEVGCRPIDFIPPLYTDSGCRVWCQLPYTVELNVLTGAASVNCIPLEDDCVTKVFVDPEGYPVYDDQHQLAGHYPAIFIKDIPIEEEMDAVPPNGPRFCLDYLSVEYYDEGGETLYVSSGALWNDGDYKMIRIVPEPNYWESVKDGRVKIFFTTCFPMHYHGC